VATLATHGPDVDPLKHGPRTTILDATRQARAHIGKEKRRDSGEL
jgi:hypothetical protein